MSNGYSPPPRFQIRLANTTAQITITIATQSIEMTPTIAEIRKPRINPTMPDVPAAAPAPPCAPMRYMGVKVNTLIIITAPIRFSCPNGIPASWNQYPIFPHRSVLEAGGVMVTVGVTVTGVVAVTVGELSVKITWINSPS